MDKDLEVYVPKFLELSSGVRACLEANWAPSTRRMYKSLWRGFEGWCAVMHVESLPADPTTVAEYIYDISRQGRKAATLNSIRAAIRFAHKAAELPDPTEATIVTQLLHSIRSEIGTAPVQKSATLPTDIRAMVNTLPADTLIGKRDRAVILLGFFTASRRSELVALTVDDLAEADNGLKITIRKSKTDQEGEGLVKGVTRQDNPPYCPVRAVMTWIDAAGITAGPIFRSVAKGGRVSMCALSAESVANIVKAAAVRAELDPTRYAGHSLRSGLVTTAAREGASIKEIMAQTGHKDTNTVIRYIQRARVIEDSVTRLIKL